MSRLRRVKFEGYIVYKPDELSHGSVEGEISHALFNTEFPVEWVINEVSNEEESEVGYEDYLE